MRQRLDLLLAVAIFAAALPSALLTEADAGVSVSPGLEAPRLPLLALMTLPIAFRRSRPLLVLVTITAATVASGVLGYSTGAAAIALVLALAGAAYYRGRTVAIVAGVVTVAILLVLLLLFLPAEERVSSESVVFNLAVIVLALITGDVLRGHREALDALDELRHVEKREAVAQDRVRIARDVHDIVGHALAAITLQARAGQRLVQRDPPGATAALEQIEEVASRALNETREAVGVIRSGAERAELQPQPTLDDLPELVRTVEAPGVEVTLRRTGGAGVPAAVQASAYRVVQESLANVVKHARPANVDVIVEQAEDVLRVAVRDDGQGQGGPGGGNGIDGMRSRVAQHGGTLAAGPAEGGGWLVEARLPGRPR